MLGKRTYGLELEWTDNDTRIEIPPKWGFWDKKETDVLNTDGTAYKYTHIGGEVGTTPTDSIDQKLENVSGLIDLLSPKLAHRSFTHVHIAIEGLKEDLPTLKTIVRYQVENQDYINDVVTPIKPVNPDDYETYEDVKLARKWARQCNIWMTRVPGPERVEEIMQAKTFDEFYQAHYPPRKDGSGRAYGVAPRPGLNMRSLHKHGTVEFRFFYGSIDVNEIRSMLEFADKYMDEAMKLEGGVPVSEWYPQLKEELEWVFPEMVPFDVEGEKIFNKTRTRH